MASLSDPRGLTLRDLFNLVGGNLDTTLLVRGPDKGYESITDVYDFESVPFGADGPPSIVFAAAGEFSLEVEWPADEC